MWSPLRGHLKNQDAVDLVSIAILLCWSRFHWLNKFYLAYIQLYVKNDKLFKESMEEQGNSLLPMD